MNDREKKLETPRLILTPAVIDDLPDVLVMNMDPDVMRYIRPVENANITEKGYRDILLKCRQDDVNLFTVREKITGAFAGWGMMLPLNGHEDLTEIGYRFNTGFWGKGYATEVARALLAWGFRDLGMTRLVAVTHLDNIASQRVLGKAGLQNKGVIRAYDTDCAFFSADAETWS